MSDSSKESPEKIRDLSQKKNSKKNLVDEDVVDKFYDFVAIAQELIRLYDRFLCIKRNRMRPLSTRYDDRSEFDALFKVGRKRQIMTILAILGHFCPQK